MLSPVRGGLIASETLAPVPSLYPLASVLGPGERVLVYCIPMTLTASPSGLRSRDAFRSRVSSLNRVNTPFAGEGRCESSLNTVGASLSLDNEGFNAVIGSCELLTDEVRLLDACAIGGAKSWAAVIGVASFAVSCFARSMSLLEGSLFLRLYPPGVAVLADDGSRAFDLVCCQPSAEGG